MDDIGVTTKSSVTMYIAGSLANPPWLDESTTEDFGIGSINSNFENDTGKHATSIGNIWLWRLDFGAQGGLASFSLASCDLKHLSGLNSEILLYNLLMQLNEEHC